MKNEVPVSVCHNYPGTVGGFVALGRAFAIYILKNNYLPLTQWHNLAFSSSDQSKHLL